MSKHSKCTDTYEKMMRQPFGICFFINFNLLGCTLRPRNTFKGGLPIANRIRNERLEIKLTEEEKALLRRKENLEM